jgi:GTP-binding protein EngB required for normal cell division/gas vesicle protein
MILGQTGVGKSTLINYLYGSEVVKTGAGPAQTPKGDFTKVTVPSPLKSGVKINILDSWGLEPDKAEDWTKLIDTRLSASLSFDQMIYGIVYCSSYSGAVMDFEIAMLKTLLEKQYKVTIALTKADNSGYETKKTVFREKFAKELAEYRGNYSVVDICAHAKPKLGQSTAQVQTFGKEALFEELERDFLVNFVNVVYARWTAWKDESIALLRDFGKRGRGKIEDFKGGFLDGNKDKARQIFNDLNNELQKIISAIQEKIKTAAEDMQEWYEKAAGAFYQGKTFSKFNSDFGEMVWSFVSGFTGLLLLDKINIKEQRELKKQLLDMLDNAVRAVEDKIQENYQVVENMHEDLRRL